MSNRSRKLLIGVALVGLVAIAVRYFPQPAVIESDPQPVATAQAAPAIVVKVKKTNLPAIKNNAFAPGEKLIYNVIYKGVTVGIATIEVIEGPPVNGRPTMKYVSTAKSTKFFDAFFKVRDQNISTVETASLFSVAFDQSLREGHFRAVRNHTFDHAKKKFNVSEKSKGKTKTKQGPLEAPVYDVLSALYAVRARELTPATEFKLSIFRNNVGKPLTVKVDGLVNDIKTPLGKVSCLRVEPILEGDSLFKSKGNKLVVWMTNDERKIPVLFEAAISVGLIRIKLDKWEKIAAN